MITPINPEQAYAVVYTKADDESWSAYYPDFPSVRVQAPQFGTVKARIAAAGRAYLSGLLEAGHALPVPRTVVGYAHPLTTMETPENPDEPEPGPF